MLSNALLGLVELATAAEATQPKCPPFASLRKCNQYHYYYDAHDEFCRVPNASAVQAHNLEGQ